MKETQYAAILKFLRRHKQATVRQLLQFTNYPSARIHEMTDIGGRVLNTREWSLVFPLERIVRLWTTTRTGQKIRLYKLERVK